MKGDWQHAGTADTYRELEPGDAFELPPRHVLPLISPTARCRRYRDSVDPSLSSNRRAGSTCMSSKGCTRRTQDMVILQMGRATSVTFHGSRRCAQYARRRARLASRRAAPGGQPSGGDEQTAALWSRGGSPSRSQEAARPASQIHVVRRNHDIANPGHRGHRQRSDDSSFRVCAASSRVGVEHLVFVSVVGVDRLSFGYFRSKLAAERVVADSGLP